MTVDDALTGGRKVNVRIGTKADVRTYIIGEIDLFNIGLEPVPGEPHRLRLVDGADPDRIVEFANGRKMKAVHLTGLRSQELDEYGRGWKVDSYDSGGNYSSSQS
jgi:hypothetical protein